MLLPCLCGPALHLVLQFLGFIPITLKLYEVCQGPKTHFEGIAKGHLIGWLLSTLGVALMS